MQIEIWDRTPLQQREEIIVATRKWSRPSGRPGVRRLDVAKKGRDGAPTIPEVAHVRLAHSSSLRGVKILRCGYNFTDGTDGLFFPDTAPGECWGQSLFPT